MKGSRPRILVGRCAPLILPAASAIITYIDPGLPRDAMSPADRLQPRGLQDQVD